MSIYQAFRVKPGIVEAGFCTVAVAVMLAGAAPSPASAAPVTPEMATKLAGKTVFLDPGHQGPNHSENLARQITDGRGGTKDCQTTGMTTVNGVPEHTINWTVAQLVKATLQDLGAKVVLSRQDDAGWGGCVDDRARAANASGADVAVSIHADGAPAHVRGFHLIVPQLPIPDAAIDQVQSGAGLAASTAVRDAYVQAGFPAATYAGARDGLQTRADIAGPALTAVPDVFIEMGNGANAEDAALLEGQEGQIKHAIAITTGLVGFLLGPQALAPAPTLGQTGSAADRPASAPTARAPQAVPQNSAVAPNSTPSGLTPLPGQVAPNAPQAIPQTGAPNSTPAGLTAPQEQAAPAPQSDPGFAPAPGYVPVPRSPNSAQAPGNGQSPNSALTPGSPQSPGTAQAPTDTDPSTNSSLGGLVDTVMQMLMPLAQSLGMDNTVISAELINLAYTLASKFLGPVK